jgi:hypothetical protein
MESDDQDGIRPTTIGPFNARQGSSNRPRIIPAPWIDCATCGWRHYPSTTSGRWHIATHCAHCGAGLVLPELPGQPGSRS